jgi:hypothetical protein
LNGKRKGERGSGKRENEGDRAVGESCETSTSGRLWLWRLGNVRKEGRGRSGSERSQQGSYGRRHFSAAE